MFGLSRVHRSPASFVTRSSARGYTEVSEEVTLEQKVDECNAILRQLKRHHGVASPSPSVVPSMAPSPSHAPSIPPSPPPERLTPRAADANRFCVQCGVSLIPGANFCYECGAAVSRGLS